MPLLNDKKKYQYTPAIAATGLSEASYSAMPEFDKEYYAHYGSFSKRAIKTALAGQSAQAKAETAEQIGVKRGLDIEKSEFEKKQRLDPQFGKKAFLAPGAEFLPREFTPAESLYVKPGGTEDIKLTKYYAQSPQRRFTTQTGEIPKELEDLQINLEKHIFRQEDEVEDYDSTTDPIVKGYERQIASLGTDLGIQTRNFAGQQRIKALDMSEAKLRQTRDKYVSEYNRLISSGEAGSPKEALEILKKRAELEGFNLRDVIMIGSK